MYSYGKHHDHDQSKASAYNDATTIHQKGLTTTIVTNQNRSKPIHIINDEPETDEHQHQNQIRSLRQVGFTKMFSQCPPLHQQSSQAGRPASRQSHRSREPSAAHQQTASRARQQFHHGTETGHQMQTPSTTSPSMLRKALNGSVRHLNRHPQLRHRHHLKHHPPALLHTQLHQHPQSHRMAMMQKQQHLHQKARIGKLQRWRFDPNKPLIPRTLMSTTVDILCFY